MKKSEAVVADDSHPSSFIDGLIEELGVFEILTDDNPDTDLPFLDWGSSSASDIPAPLMTPGFDLSCRDAQGIVICVRGDGKDQPYRMTLSTLKDGESATRVDSIRFHLEEEVGEVSKVKIEDDQGSVLHDGDIKAFYIALKRPTESKSLTVKLFSENTSNPFVVQQVPINFIRNDMRSLELPLVMAGDGSTKKCSVERDQSREDDVVRPISVRINILDDVGPIGKMLLKENGEVVGEAQNIEPGSETRVTLTKAIESPELDIEFYRRNNPSFFHKASFTVNPTTENDKKVSPD